MDNRPKQIWLIFYNLLTFPMRNLFADPHFPKYRKLLCVISLCIEGQHVNVCSKSRTIKNGDAPYGQMGPFHHTLCSKEISYNSIQYEMCVNKFTNQEANMFVTSPLIMIWSVFA